MYVGLSGWLVDQSECGRFSCWVRMCTYVSMDLCISGRIGKLATVQTYFY